MTELLERGNVFFGTVASGATSIMARGSAWRRRHLDWAAPFTHAHSP